MDGSSVGTHHLPSETASSSAATSQAASPQPPSNGLASDSSQSSATSTEPMPRAVAAAPAARFDEAQPTVVSHIHPAASSTRAPGSKAHGTTPVAASGGVVPPTAPAAGTGPTPSTASVVPSDDTSRSVLPPIPPTGAAGAVMLVEAPAPASAGALPASVPAISTPAVLPAVVVPAAAVRPAAPVAAAPSASPSPRAASREAPASPSALSMSNSASAPAVVAPIRLTVSTPTPVLAAVPALPVIVPASANAAASSAASSPLREVVSPRISIKPLLATHSATGPSPVLKIQTGTKRADHPAPESGSPSAEPILVVSRSRSPSMLPLRISSGTGTLAASPERLSVSGANAPGVPPSRMAPFDLGVADLRPAMGSDLVIDLSSTSAPSAAEWTARAVSDRQVGTGTRAAPGKASSDSPVTVIPRADKRSRSPPGGKSAPEGVAMPPVKRSKTQARITVSTGAPQQITVLFSSPAPERSASTGSPMPPLVAVKPIAMPAPGTAPAGPAPATTDVTMTEALLSSASAMAPGPSSPPSSSPSFPSSPSSGSSAVDSITTSASEVASSVAQVPPVAELPAGEQSRRLGDPGPQHPLAHTDPRNRVVHPSRAGSGIYGLSSPAMLAARATGQQGGAGPGPGATVSSLLPLAAVSSQAARNAAVHAELFARSILRLCAPDTAPAQAVSPDFRSSAGLEAGAADAGTFRAVAASVGGRDTGQSARTYPVVRRSARRASARSSIAPAISLMPKLEPPSVDPQHLLAQYISDDEDSSTASDSSQSDDAYSSQDRASSPDLPAVSSDDGVDDVSSSDESDSSASSDDATTEDDAVGWPRPRRGGEKGPAAGLGAVSQRHNGDIGSRGPGHGCSRATKRLIAATQELLQREANSLGGASVGLTASPTSRLMRQIARAQRKSAAAAVEHREAGDTSSSPVVPLPAVAPAVDNQLAKESVLKVGRACLWTGCRRQLSSFMELMAHIMNDHDTRSPLSSSTSPTPTASASSAPVAGNTS
ncbi:hypothetical protein H696_03919 [Fonticula alba]|uniref:C2H2-type domain-containing protein n=1 Tax=Fonticula alba TaxID=691883 RepID=A0A058Z7M5_FONAL|nr:hypothetical protein H696_03919 [Fonticula alba]KCV69497.1 hypothetical protein H696_03919 [Fonticula alba]|eukprot:XP_009496062.1 hypothetical protein H696_03919 [Fonticula alba]